MGVLFHAHSGLRYLVLLAGFATAAWLLYCVARSRPFDRSGRVLTSLFTGILDLQVLLGLLLLMSVPFYPALAGHILMMIAAALVAHGAGMVNKRRPAEKRGIGVALIGVVVPLALIVGGIMSIGRTIF